LSFSEFFDFYFGSFLSFSEFFNFYFGSFLRLGEPFHPLFGSFLNLGESGDYVLKLSKIFGFDQLLLRLFNGGHNNFR
jgi:hypothetical protein